MGRMYTLKNNTEKNINEKIIVNGKEVHVRIFPKEIVYNIDVQSLSLGKNTKLEVMEQNARVITQKMLSYWKTEGYEPFAEGVMYSQEQSSDPKVLIVTSNEMRLVGQDANIQYTSSRLDVFFKGEFSENVAVVNIVDTDSALGQVYDLNGEKLKNLKQLIESKQKEFNIKNEKTVFLGSSIGATASILLSQHFPKSHVVAAMPIMKKSDFFIDNFGRKNMYFLDKNDDIAFDDKFIEENKYHIYWGTLDTPSHNHLYSNLLKHNYSEQIKLTLGTIGHSAAGEFKNDIRYQVQSMISQFAQADLKLNEVKTSITNNVLNFSAMIAEDLDLENGIQGLINVEYNSKRFNYGLKMEGKKILAKIDLADVMTLAELQSDFEIKVEIRDILEKIIYSSSKIEIKENYVEIESFKENQIKTIKPVYYYRDEERFAVEFEVPSTRKIAFAFLVTQKDNEELYIPLTVNERVFKTRIMLNSRKQITTKIKTGSMILEIIYADNTKQNFVLNQE